MVTTPPPQEPQLADTSEDAPEDKGSHAAGLSRSENGSTQLRRGLAVAPRIGRLLLFSGGAENYHAPLPVGRGRRQSLQAFFGCRCTEAIHSL